MARFDRPGGFLRLFDRPEEGPLVLRPAVIEYLATGNVSDRPGMTFFHGAADKPSGPLLIQRETADHLDAAFCSPEKLCVLLSGPAGGGKRFQIEHLFARQKADCVIADASGDDALEKARDAALAADLMGAYLCLRRLDGDGEDPPPQDRMEALEGLELLQNKRFFLSRTPLRGGMRTLALELELPEVTEEERLAAQIMRDNGNSMDITA